MQLVLLTADDGDELTVLAGTAGEPAPLPAGLPVKSTSARHKGGRRSWSCRIATSSSSTVMTTRLLVLYPRPQPSPLNDRPFICALRACHAVVHTRFYCLCPESITQM